MIPCSRPIARAAARRLPPLGLLLLLTMGCSTPVGVKRVSAHQVHQTLTANVLTSREPSAASVQMLHRFYLMDRFRREPRETLAALHAKLIEDDENGDLLFALAELSFLHAEKSREPPHFLAAAVYAYAFLAQSDLERFATALDPRFRLAADLYNRGITAGLASADGEQVVLEPRTLPLPFGDFELEVDPNQFLWGGFRLAAFEPVAELEVRGLRNRYRQAGLGAPLAASLATADLDEVPPSRQFIPERMKVPATAFIALRDVRRGIALGRVRGTLVLHTLDDARSLNIGGLTLPLEYEPSAALAASLAETSWWEFERKGFFSGDIAEQSGELFLMHPYHPGRIPIVLVHGTASSPARWANLVNELQNDPFILEHFQVWLFRYNTGNPVAYSGGLLREALTEAVGVLDPDRKDPALQHVIVIGHSQGGLLTKLTVIDVGTRFWDAISDKPLDELDLKPETRAILERSLFFEPLPFVRRVVFIATPHRGSFRAARLLGRLASRLVSLPRDLVDIGVELVASDDFAMMRSLDQLPSSIDNMTPSNPFLLGLAETPIDAAVTAHSIIAVKGDGPVEEGDDGVVAFSSAHIEGVASEYVVRSGHSTQSHPHTIRELRRILYEHARGVASVTAASP